MNGEFNNLKFKYEIQDKYISEITKNVESDIVHIWTAEERGDLTEEEIDEIYLRKPVYYSINVDIIYPKAANASSDSDKVIKKSSINAPIFEKNGFEYKNSKNLHIFLSLEKETLEKLRIWTKKAVKFFQNYLWEYDQSILRGIRFDLIPNKDKTKFTILNLPVESIKISKKPRSSIISSDQFLKDRYAEYESFMNSSYMQWQRKRLEEMKKLDGESNE